MAITVVYYRLLRH